MHSRALSASHSGPIMTRMEQEPAEEINSAHREQRPLELPREILTFLKCEPVRHCFCHTYLHTMHILHKTRRTNDNRNNSTKQTAGGQKVKFSPWDSRYLGLPGANRAEPDEPRALSRSLLAPGSNPPRTQSSFAISLPSLPTPRAQYCWKYYNQRGNA